MYNTIYITNVVLEVTQIELILPGRQTRSHWNVIHLEVGLEVLYSTATLTPSRANQLFGLFLQ